MVSYLGKVLMLPEQIGVSFIENVHNVFCLWKQQQQKCLHAGVTIAIIT